MVTGIIVAAGRGTRMGAAENKVFLKIYDKTILEYTTEAFLKCADIDEIVIVTGSRDVKRCCGMFKNVGKPVKVVSGGETRQQSVCNGIMAADGDIAAIHDGARALITPQLISQAVGACRQFGAAALGVMSKDTVKLADKEGFIERTLDRSYTYQIQTPQVFECDIIKKAHKENMTGLATDDCALVETMGIAVKIVEGSYENIKITTPEDMLVAEAILKQRGF